VPGKPNILLILTDQLRHPPGYESEELARFRAENLPAVARLEREGAAFRHHYPMASACAPSRASLLTGHYPSLHGVSQTDGLAKSAEGGEVTWLDPGGVPTLGDWFRAAGYRTYFKGKWHASHAHLDADDGDGYLLSIDDDGKPLPENIERYLEADLLDGFGFSEWVGPEPHGLGEHNMGTVKDPFTADETIDLLARLEDEPAGPPWLTVCSFLNPHDDSFFGLVGLMQGLRYHPGEVPPVAPPPTRHEDLSTKPTCHQSYADSWARLGAPQPWIETHLKFYYQLQAAVGEQIGRVLDALAASPAAAETIVVFSSDHGDMQGAHGGMHEKWHVAYEEALRVPFVVAGPAVEAGREIEFPTNHADLIPTLLGLAGVDPDEVLAELKPTHAEARALVGRDLSADLGPSSPASANPEPVFFMTDDEISEGSEPPLTPFNRLARLTKTFSTVTQPNHLETVVAAVEVGGETRLAKLTRYHDNQQFWTAPGEFDDRLEGRHTRRVTDPEPDEWELYDLTADPWEERNLAHPEYADAGAAELRARMVELLAEQLGRKRLVPTGGEAPGYRPPAEFTVGKS
jgi:arylsulfatase A-like enzyme